MLSSKEKERYERNILVAAIGIQGQEKLLQSKVLLVGAGGLGSPVALYLTAAGWICLIYNVRFYIRKKQSVKPKSNRPEHGYRN